MCKIFIKNLSNKVLFIHIALAQGYPHAAHAIALSISDVHYIMHNAHQAQENWIDQIHTFGSKNKLSTADTLHLIAACIAPLAYSQEPKDQDALQPCQIHSLPCYGTHNINLVDHVLSHITTYRNERGKTLNAELAEHLIPYGHEAVIHAFSICFSEMQSIEDVLDASDIGTCVKELPPYTTKLMHHKYRHMYHMLTQRKYTYCDTHMKTLPQYVYSNILTQGDT